MAEGKRQRGGAVRDGSNGRETGSRFDSSLGLLTRKFVNLVRESEDGQLDLNSAAQTLEVQKRRIYDITNVLEGVGVIEKRSKNLIAWIVRSDDDASGEKEAYMAEMDAVRKELETLSVEEAQLDEEIDHLQYSIREMVSPEEGASYAYVTYDDINSVPELRNDTLIAIKAPPGTELKVPEAEDSRTNGEKSYRIFVKSPGGPIDCFLVSPDEKAAVPSEPDTQTSGVEEPFDWLLDDELSGPGFTKLTADFKALSPEYETSMYFQAGVGDRDGDCRGVSDLFAEVINENHS